MTIFYIDKELTGDQNKAKEEDMRNLLIATHIWVRQDSDGLKYSIKLAIGRFTIISDGFRSQIQQAHYYLKSKEGQAEDLDVGEHLDQSCRKINDLVSEISQLSIFSRNVLILSLWLCERPEGKNEDNADKVKELDEGLCKETIHNNCQEEYVLEFAILGEIHRIVDELIA